MLQRPVQCRFLLDSDDAEFHAAHAASFESSHAAFEPESSVSAFIASGCVFSSRSRSSRAATRGRGAVARCCVATSSASGSIAGTVFDLEFG